MEQPNAAGMVAIRDRMVPVREAWLPECEPLQPRAGKRGVAGTPWSPAALLGSHFDGLPYLADEAWPTCPSCSERLALCLQLNAEDDPREVERLPNGTLLQLFMCDRDCWQREFAQARELPSFWHLRLVDATSPPVLPEGDHPMRIRQAYRIAGWAARTTPPDERDDFYLDGEWENWLEECRGLGLLPERGAVGGFPPLLFGSEDASAECSRCGADMDFMLSVDLSDWLFVNAYGWVLQCPAHPHDVAFRWNWDGR